MSAIADEVKVGDIIWGRTVAAVKLPDRNDKWDTQVMFEFEDGGLLHVSQNRLIEDHRRPTSKDVTDAVKNLESYIRWAATGSDHRLRAHAADVRLVLNALEDAQKTLREAAWRDDYDRQMSPEPGRDGWL